MRMLKIVLDNSTKENQNYIYFGERKRYGKWGIYYTVEICEGELFGEPFGWKVLEMFEEWEEMEEKLLEELENGKNK